jgi:hypothetical protein
VEYDEAQTLRRLGLFAELGVIFRTTKCQESIKGLVEQRTEKIDCWKNSERKQRWLATALLDIEPRLRRVGSRKHLRAPRRALQAHKKASGSCSRSKSGERQRRGTWVTTNC